MCASSSATYHKEGWARQQHITNLYNSWLSFPAPKQIGGTVKLVEVQGLREFTFHCSAYSKAKPKIVGSEKQKGETARNTT